MISTGGNAIDGRRTFGSQLLYLEDLVPGQRWVSGTCRVTKPPSGRLPSSSTRSRFIWTRPRRAVDVLRRPGGEWLAHGGPHHEAAGDRRTATGGGTDWNRRTLSWPKPTRPGDVLRVETEVVEVKPSRSRPDRGNATFRCSTLNERNEVVQLFMGNLLVWRRKTP